MNQKQVLIILDNIEDLLNNEITDELKFTGILESILSKCPGVKLLCTSRKKIETNINQGVYNLDVLSIKYSV